MEPVNDRDPDPRPATPYAKRRRSIKWSLISLAALLVLFYGGMGWVFSSKIQDDAFAIEAPGVPKYETEVLSVGQGQITLSLDSDSEHLEEPGIRGMSWRAGYGQVGEILQRKQGTSVTRQYFPIVGMPVAGDLVDLDGFAYPGDPLTAFGLSFDLVTYQSDLGPIHAWLIPESGDSWAILVHGKSSPRRDTLRLLPVLHGIGLNVLIIDYRNDVGAPRDRSGVYGYGKTEWRDVEAAVRYAQDEGADSVALVGFSMGGGIVASFMLESPLAASIDAVVLDSPMLDFSQTIDLGARHSSIPVIGLPVPQSLTNVAKVLATWRFDIDWSAVNYLDDLADPSLYDTPTLVFHGTEDERVPLATSRQFAEQRPDAVRLETFEDAGHVLSWNVDQARYEQALIDFLKGLLG